MKGRSALNTNRTCLIRPKTFGPVTCDYDTGLNRPACPCATPSRDTMLAIRLLRYDPRPRFAAQCPLDVFRASNERLWATTFQEADRSLDLWLHTAWCEVPFQHIAPCLGQRHAIQQAL